MRERVFQIYKRLQANTHNYMVYFEQNKRYVKTFQEFHSDVEMFISRLNHLKTNRLVEHIAVLGPTSYKWMVIDHACIQGGYQSIAIPETYSSENIENIIKENKVDILLCDYKLKDYKDYNVETYYYNCSENHSKNFENIKQATSIDDEGKNKILEDYTIVFSSGTSEKIKKIIWSFNTIDENKNITLIGKVKFIYFFLKYKLSFWSRSDNKVIIFMPFSHPIQRAIAIRALAQRINIVLSDPKECLKHIITEKPNIMFAIPLVYEALTQNIKHRINKFTKTQKVLFFIFNKLKINTLANGNPLKRVFSFLLFKKIKKIYGSKADYFVTGSAPINPEVQRVFYSIGVKIFDAYGQTETFDIMSNHKNFRIGSVGRPGKGLAKISEDGELMLKYDEKNLSKNKDILNISGEWIHTGDLAYIDKDGFLFITGRKDDLIVLNNGKKVNPHKVESTLLQSEVIKHALVFTKNSLNISAIIDVKERNQEIIDKVKKIISKSNDSFASYEQISNIYIANEHFTVDNGLLTGTLKMKRKAIIERHKNVEFERVII